MYKDMPIGQFLQSAFKSAKKGLGIDELFSNSLQDKAKDIFQKIQKMTEGSIQEIVKNGVQGMVEYGILEKGIVIISRGFASYLNKK
jgi:hypothetical protein